MKQIKRIISQPFGTLSNGKTCQLFTLSNIHGAQVSITNYGGIITRLTTKDIQGKLANIVLSYNNIQDYENDSLYLGAIIGPYANRIEKGQVKLDSQTIQLTINDKNNHLHGGNNGLNTKLWQAQTKENEHSASLMLTTNIMEGDDGYPSDMKFQVNYTFDDNNTVTIEYQVSTLKTTIINLTQHSYFNLAGELNCHQNSMINHQLFINADEFLPINNQGIPTGTINNVSKTPFDFKKMKDIAKDIKASDEQIQLGHGFDHYWLFPDEVKTEGQLAAQVIEPISGRRLSLYTDQPGMQFYSGNFLDGSETQDKYQRRSGFCLETQHAPNQINLPTSLNLASTILEPEKPFYSKTIFKFDCVTA